MTRPRELGVTATLLGPLLAGDSSKPRITWYGAGRTELSTASLANWSAKVAGLLCDELGGTTGGVVVVRTTPSWQVVPLLLGAWWAGMTITDQDDPAALAAFVDPGADAASDEVFVVSGHPLGAPSTDVQAHQRDFSTAVLPQGDRFAPWGAGPAPDSPAVLTAAGATSVVDLLDQARAAAAAIGSGGRLFAVDPPTLPHGVVAGVLGALAADGSLIQIGPGFPAGADHAVRLASVAGDERATVTLGTDIPGLRRVGG
ncbi:MAG TPA: TIGR03089 family protein [Mycobacterium sp.]